MRWHDFWWRRVTSFWSALVEADAGSLHSMIFHDAIQLALAGCKFSWAAQCFKCFSTLGEPLPLIPDAPITIDINLLQEHFMRDRLASFDSLPQDPSPRFPPPAPTPTPPCGSPLHSQPCPPAVLCQCNCCIPPLRFLAAAQEAQPGLMCWQPARDSYYLLEYKWSGGHKARST